MTTNPPEIPPESRRPTERADAGTKTKTALTPEEVSLESDDVAPLGDNRYLVRAERGPESDREAAATADSTAADDDHEPSEPQGPNYARVLAAAPEPHGVDLTLKTDGEIAHHRVMSNDVREVFVEMLTWYAGQLDDDLTPGEALQVMLAATDLEVGTD